MCVAAMQRFTAGCSRSPGPLAIEPLEVEMKVTEHGLNSIKQTMKDGSSVISVKRIKNKTGTPVVQES